MTELYLRKVSLVTIAASGESIDFSQMHFKFRVQRGDIQTPNTADIRIYNLSDSTINKLTNALKQEYIALTLQAGYAGQFGVLFQGTIKQLRSGRENATDTYLDITAADGDGAYNFGVVAISLAAGSTQAQQVGAIVKGLSDYGISSGPLDGLSTTALPRGKVIFGLARDGMRKIANSSQVSWSIQNGQLGTVALNNFLPVEPIPVNSASGMIGLPEMTQDGIKVRTLINPNILIGAAIQLNNKSIQQFRFPIGLSTAANNALIAQTIHTNADGYYKVLWVDYDGDTRGQNWYGDITCIAIDAFLGQGQIKNPRGVIAPSGPPAPVVAYAPGNKFPGQN